MNELFRAIPATDLCLDALIVADQNLEAAPRALLRELVTQFWDARREDIRAGRCRAAAQLNLEAQLPALLTYVRAGLRPRLRPVLNATGVVVHTNLGRSVLAEEARQAVALAADGYCNLELNLRTGGRGSRYDLVENLICRLSGAEAALVVNNNAAAVLLILSALGKGGEVITSRGELVEIGGSFRIPEIMVQCGCTLREVGATNKTHLRDYENAIGPETRALLKVHTSNFKIMGFSQSVPLDELVALGREKGLPVIEDLGSGSLVDLEQFGIHDEPTVQQSVKAGVDIISFSGDKLLGGPQAGIILGKAEYIRQLKRHPLARAMRVDKMTIAALRETLYAYTDEELACREIPVLAMLGAKSHQLREKAGVLCAMLQEQGVKAQVVPTQDQVGGGSVPTQLLDAWAVAIDPGQMTVDQLEEKLRLRPLPIIGRITHEQYILDVRTLMERDFAYIAQTAGEVVK